jgi:hypothetical protein
MAQYEFRDEAGGLLDLYTHNARKSDAKTARDEEDLRMIDLVRRCLKMARIAVDLYFEELEAREFNAEV